MAESPISTFISYSRADSAFIDRLEADLRAYGFDTWVDRQHLEGGADWARVIEQQIQQRETLVVALSP
ncbi:MAG TPA: toll/interleukin-1 receptor domain-containing protein, partial [Ktedonobacterales bacterium]